MKKIIALLLILSFTCICMAQSTQLKELHFNRLSIKNGLPEGVITSMVQDKEGYIWVGTQGGLVRYDGYSAKVYQFGIKDPLRASVVSVYETPAGELWIGSAYNGLYHYNRAADTFFHYKLNSPVNGSNATFIISILEDLRGNPWMIMVDPQTGGGSVNMFDTKKHQFTEFGFFEKSNHHINASQCLNLCADSKGHIWLGTNNGFYEYSSSAAKFIPHFATTDSSQQKRFDRLTEDAVHPGTLWMNVVDNTLYEPEGLLRYNTIDNTVKRYHHIPDDSTSLSSDSVFTIQKDSHRRIWFSTGNGLSLFEASSQHFINYNIKDKKPNFWDNVIWLLAEDRAGNFWGGNGALLTYFNTKTHVFTHYKTDAQDPDALPVNGYDAMLIDRAGTLWVGTVPEGLYWVNNMRSAFTMYKNEPGKPHYYPGGGNTSFAEDKDGTFWLASSNGLYHWFPSSDSFALIKILKEREEYNYWHFSSVLKDSKGIVWCTPYGKGLFGYNPKTGKLKHFVNNAKDSSSLSANEIATLFEDTRGTLWVGTMGGGLCRFNRETENFKRYPFISLKNNNHPPDKHAVNDAVVYAICEDKRGELWLGTNNSGISRFNTQSETFTPLQNQWLNDNVVGKIFEDSKRHIWIGTHASGLFMYDPDRNTLKKFSEANGLQYNGVLGMNEDNRNNLWITSSRGISILNLQTNKITNLSSINGLPAEPDYSMFLKTSKGQFLMECNNGFISFDPEQLKPDTSLPVIHIESVEFTQPQKQENKQADSIIYSYGKNEINLRYNENRITFNYVGLQYQNSQLNQYAYKLDGYDNAWIKAGTQRKVTYTNLSPDTYVFHVKAANSDGVWNPQEQTLTVIISPPWWRTWWAYTLYAIVFAGAVWAFVAYRSRKLKKENKILEEKVEHRTEQLTRSIENLKSTQQQLIQSEKMASLGELTAGIAHEIQNPLNFVNNFSEVNTELLDELKQEINKGNIQK